MLFSLVEVGKMSERPFKARYVCWYVLTGVIQFAANILYWALPVCILLWFASVVFYLIRPFGIKHVCTIQMKQN